GWRRGCGRAKARPASGLRRRTLSPFRYRTLLLSWTIFCIVCFAVSELAASAQLPPVQNPLVPGQNPTTAGCSTTEASSCAQVAAKLLPIVMGPSPMEENLRRLTDGIGGRVSGSPEMAKAVEWAVAAFRTAGIEIHTEKYTLPATWTDLFNEYLRLPPILDRAIQRGAAAILWMGARERLLLYRHTNSLNGEIDKIPQAILAREDAMRLARTIAAYPAKVRVHFEMPNKTGGPIEQQNVVGEIRGYEKPDEVVILGAHLDSWELGSGALDNGCNAALVMEAARAIKATGLLPRRTVRFILFSGEEQGTIGSREYVKSHQSELEKVRAMITFDEGIGRVTGYSLGGRRDIEAGVRETLKPVESWGANHHTYDAFF